MEEGFGPKPPVRQKAELARHSEHRSPRQHRGQLARVQQDLGTVATAGHAAAKLKLKRPNGYQSRRELTSTRVYDVYRQNTQPGGQLTRKQTAAIEHHVAPSRRQHVARGGQSQPQRHHMAHDPRVARQHSRSTRERSRKIAY